jgi:hypothetical protein
MSFTNRIVIEKIKEVGLNDTVKLLHDSHHSSQKCDMKAYRKYLKHTKVSTKTKDD